MREWDEEGEKGKEVREGMSKEMGAVSQGWVRVGVGGGDKRFIVSGT